MFRQYLWKTLSELSMVQMSKEVLLMAKGKLDYDYHDYIFAPDPDRVTTQPYILWSP